MSSASGQGVRAARPAARGGGRRSDRPASPSRSAQAGSQAARGNGAGTLTRQQVLEAALAIVAADGIDALSVRGLAAALGVAVTSLYWHVGDKDALLDGVADLIVSRLGPIAVRGRTPEARLRSAGCTLRRILGEQADLVAVVHQRGKTADLFQPARQVLLAEMLQAGVRPRVAVRWVEAILHLVVGSVLLDRQVARQPAQQHRVEELWRADELAAQPALARALSQPVDEDELFRHSLDVLVRAALSG